MAQVFQINYARIRRCLLMMCMALVGGPSAYAWDLSLDETFSGTGSFTSSVGQPGFENPGWFSVGSPGAFINNGFGESVLHVSTVTPSVQDGLFRIIGSEAFTAIAEFSNPAFSSNGFSAAGINVADSPDVVGLSILENSNSTLRASFASTVGGVVGSGGSLSLGANVDRVTLKLEYEPDLVNGGGLFTGYVDVNESGTFSLVGIIDGSQYTTDAAISRTMFLGTYAFENNASVEVDRLTIFGSIPEPASCPVVACVLIASFMRRSRKKAANDYSMIQIA